MFSTFYLQSEYSLLKNTIPLVAMVERAEANQYTWLALADDNLHALYRFITQCEKAHIKPVIGLKLDVIYNLYETSFFAYVKTQKGYENLLALALKKTQEKLTYQHLVDHQEGLIFITSGNDSIVTKQIMSDDLIEAQHILTIFKKDIKNLYLGLCLDTLDLEMKVAPHLTQLAEQNRLKLLPLHQTSYMSDDEKEAYEALLKIGKNDTELPKDANYKFLDQQELQALFIDYPYVFDNADEVVKNISFEWQTPRFDMPVYETKNATSEAYLKSLAIIGLKKRLADQKVNHQAYQQRLMYELNVIHQMGYDNYFLIVFDFVRYAKQHDVLVGPGRGSAAGSLVSYCLGITDVDPIKYDLLFERFLNPERITMPDIDMDFPDNRRDEVIRYVQEKYGKQHMISIVTFGTFALKSSIRDIARVMAIDPQRVTGIIKRVINHEIDETDYELMRLLSVSKKIEGLPRQTGTHAAGMILAKQDLTKYLPLQMDSNGYYQSQWEASDLEKLGLLKIDFLGIRNLAIIHDVVQMIKIKNPQFVLTDIPLNDAKVYDCLSQADTNGIFQLESAGMRAVLLKLKPRDFEDIVAILALYRPGPMDHIDTYIARRNGAPFSYLHQDLEPILKSTYGIIVYQEQIMKIAHEFAGYTLAEADLLRRGISKKNHDILETERVRFIAKCKAQGYSQSIAKEIYDYIVKFADYGFNRSHSVAYSMVAYQMAYLKVNYYEMFMTVLLSNVIGNSQTTYDYIQDIKRHGIKVLPPDINESTDCYILTEKGIRLPLTQVKNLGKIQVARIMEERSRNTFKDYQDFKSRLASTLNAKNIEMLIDTGALDCFGMNHHTMIEHRDTASANYEVFMKDFKMKAYEELPFSEMAEREKLALGFNLTYHPLVVHQNYIDNHQLDKLSDIRQKSQIKALGFVSSVKEITTKNGKKMAFVTIEDGETKIETTLFTKIYATYEKEIYNQEIKIFVIKENHYQNKKSYILQNVYRMV